MLILDEKDLEYIWDSISSVQCVFHPRLSRNGEIDISELYKVKNEKKIIVLFDRNILSSLLKLTRQGYLNDENEMRSIALLMTWIILNRFSASAGLALMEYATKVNSSKSAKLELKEFNNIFEYYPSMIWKQLAEGVIDEIPICTLKREPCTNDLEYNNEDDHFLMQMAKMLYTVYLHRRKDLSSVDKMIKFLEWNYKNLLISESTIVYAAMLFTNQEGIKPPKAAGSSDIHKIIDGCRNQAWDLNYLSNWSCFHYYEQNMNEIFMFATNDIQLKTIFINTYSDGGSNELIDGVFLKKRCS